MSHDKQISYLRDAMNPPKKHSDNPTAEDLYQVIRVAVSELGQATYIDSESVEILLMRTETVRQRCMDYIRAINAEKAARDSGVCGDCSLTREQTI